MKKVIICLVLTMISVAGYAQSVVGKWVTEGGDSQLIKNKFEGRRNYYSFLLLKVKKRP